MTRRGCKLCPEPAALLSKGLPMCERCHQKWVIAYAESDSHEDANGERSGDEPVTDAQVADAKTHRQHGDTVHMVDGGGWEWIPPKAA